MVGAAALAVSAWPAPATTVSDQQVSTAAHVTNARVLFSLLPLLVPGIIEISASANGGDSNPVPMFVATVVLVLLAFARTVRLVRVRDRQQAALERSRHYYAALAENSSDAVIVVDAAGQILNDAPNLAAMLGRNGEPTAGRDALHLLRPIDRDRARSALDRWWSTSGVVVDAEVQATPADGSARWFGVRATNLSNDPVVAGMVVHLRDITNRKRAEQELSHNAFHDSLTGLANRALLRDRLEHALERTARSGRSVAVIHLDLDDFKVINDTRGHEAGDQVLREVAACLSSIVRGPDTVSRLGGDEFAVLIEESTHALDEAETVAERILKSLTSPFVFDGQQVVLTASIGISVGDNESTTSSMLRDADVAMYQAKTAGKAGWTVYEPSMRAAALERQQLDNDLHHALEARQLRIVYQPVVELESSTITGFEALLRWDHPTLGLIAPSTFIPIAENNGTIVAIGRWVLDGACATAAQWQRTYPGVELTVAVNLSALQIATPDIVDDVARALEQSGLQPTSLVLEITETVLMQDAATASERLEELRSLGVHLAIDDFGTGYSSLSYLRQFPVDIMKIDKSFTDTISDPSQIPAIVHGLFDLAKTLHMQTIAEGIEFDEQLDGLRDQKCDFGQGFLFAKPLDLADVTTFLSHSKLQQRPVPALAGVQRGNPKPQQSKQLPLDPCGVEQTFRRRKHRTMRTEVEDQAPTRGTERALHRSTSTKTERASVVRAERSTAGPRTDAQR